MPIFANELADLHKIKFFSIFLKKMILKKDFDFLRRIYYAYGSGG